MEIRILSSGKEMGPYSESQVRQYLSEGLIAPSDLALGAGLSEWQTLDRLLAGLPFPEQARTSVRHEEAPRSITVRATSKVRSKRGPIVLQQPFAAGAAHAPKPNRIPKAALTIEAPRPTTQLPPVAKFTPPEETPAPPPVESHLPPEPVSYPEVQAFEPADEVPAETQDAPEDVLPAEPPQPKPEGFTRAAPAEEFERIPNVIIYSGALVGLVLLGLVSAAGYFIWHFSMPAPRSAAPPTTAVTETSIVPHTSDDFSVRGFARQSQGDLEGALSDYDQAIALDPQNAQAFYRRAVARQTKGDWDGALADYNALLVIKPDDANAFSNRGFVRQTRGDLDGALADYTEALAHDPKIAVAYYNIGLIKVRRGDVDGGIEAYNRALDINPSLTRAYYNRGKAKSAEGNLEGAIADYTQALNLDPGIATAYLERGVARQGKGDFDGALGDYSQALEHDSNMAQAYYNRSYIELLHGALGAAVGDSSQAITLDPNDAKAFFNRGLAELGQSDFEHAEADLRKYGELAPRESDCDIARLYLWVSVTEQGAIAKADEELATALQNDWNSSPEDLTSKVASFLLGHIREPEIIADAATPDVSREPGRYCKVWYFAGIKRLMTGDTATALNYFQKAVATDQKDFCEYIFARAELVSLGQSREASSQPPSAAPPQ
jgi:tetratricopeptide (TPR) repeat protein